MPWTGPDSGYHTDDHAYPEYGADEAYGGPEPGYGAGSYGGHGGYSDAEPGYGYGGGGHGGYGDAEPGYGYGGGDKARIVFNMVFGWFH